MVKVRFLKRRTGQGLTEYAVTVALVIAIAVLSFANNGPLATSINSLFGVITTVIAAVNP